MTDGPNFEAARDARRIAEQAATWYIEQRCELTERQRAAFLAWLRASPEHVREYLAIAQMHGNLKAASSRESLTAEELVEWVGRANPVIMFPRMDAAATRGRIAEPGRRRSNRWRLLAGVAACAAMLVLAVATGMRWREVHAGTPERFTAGPDAVRSIKLSDGTLVQLDRGSIIDVQFDTDRRRIEVVQGNALFDVGKDPARPLLVRVGRHVLQDIGTVFDVRRHAEGDQLTVINGRVRVWRAAPDVPAGVLDPMSDSGMGRVAVADLVAGQQIEMGALKVGDVQPVEIAKVVAWLPPDIQFRHETVGEVARRFNAYTSTPLTVEDARVADMRISGVFHANNPQAFIAYLASLPGVRVIAQGNRVRVVPTSTTAREREQKM